MIAQNPKYDGYQRRLASMVYKFFDKKTTSGMNVNEVQELHKHWLNKLKGKKCIQGLKIVFGLQI